MSYEGHIAELDRIKQMALKKGSFSSAVNAETNRGKAAGLYIDRKIIKHGKLEELSEVQLEAKMKQILEDYAPLLTLTLLKVRVKKWLKSRHLVKFCHLQNTRSWKHRSLRKSNCTIIINIITANILTVLLSLLKQVAFTYRCC